jgi:electron transport protein HydN
VVAHSDKSFFELDPDGYAFNPRLFMAKTTLVTTPVHCRHCENPACKASCLSKAISVVDNRVLVDAKKCIGCKNCVAACPFGAMEIVDTGRSAPDGLPIKVALKCDLCEGVADSPACVKVCLTEALELVTEGDLKNDLAAKRRAAAVAAQA